MSPFHHGGLECKSRSQETSGVTGKFGLVVKKKKKRKQGKGKQFYQENARVTATPSSSTREDSTRRYHQMVNTKIRLIIVFAGKDGEAPYNQQKQDQELPAPQIMNSLLPNPDLNWRK